MSTFLSAKMTLLILVSLNGCNATIEPGSVYLISRGFGTLEEVNSFEEALVNTLAKEDFTPSSPPVQARRVNSNSDLTGTWWENSKGDYVRIARIHKRDTLVQVFSLEDNPRIKMQLDTLVQQGLNAEAAEENADK
ncbi:MAG: hypothetical protein SFV81_07490 [Pirellulaceae bacterium]|nr:hypothetical protein [Pirellulaceae bacterium]